MKRRDFLSIAGLPVASYAQTLYAPKGKAAQYVAPHKPHTKLADLQGQHKGEKQWRHLVVNDKHLRSEYLHQPTGFKHPKAMHPDTRAWWVVMDGEVRFDIETVEPFVAKKGSMVQVPMQTFFSYEVLQPATIFETNVAGAHTLYAEEKDAPREPGITWTRTKFNSRVIARWLNNNKPHVTYDECAKKIDAGEVKGFYRFVEDDRGTANFIYGYDSKLPKLDPKQRGHFHPEGAEYWLIMSGQIRYPIEDVGVVIANAGDVVYVPPFTWHAPRWWGPGASCRLAMNGFPQIAHMFDPD